MPRSSSKGLSSSPLESGINFTHLGHQLSEFLADAQVELLVVAPFIKVDALERLLADVSESVQVDIFTRWRLSELSIGVSDIDVWKAVENRENTRLFLVNNLHAKYFRSDAKVITGSANVTATALGWSLAPNLELLISTDADDSCVKFEDSLSSSSIEVNEVIYREFALKLAEIDPPQILYSPDACPVLIDFNYWTPSTRDPSDIWRVYSGHPELVAERDFAEIKSILSLVDLSATRLEDQTRFRKFFAAIILSLPFFKKISESFDSALRFREGTELMEQLLNLSKEDAKAQWQVAIRWLIYFAPDQFEVSRRNYSETLQRRP
jgi:hypothetical protein